MRSIPFRGSDAVAKTWHENCHLQSGSRKLAPVESCDV
ncbi:hypothetical protein RISK_006329 [Rhodopirellula islandica]|uniref:Uncharacterized protein n=1 Tax=Rhodopirellula islandica TaxID=595434 RepID=A0A0J1B4R9_RHOIS|nr:hypothetical protein RISK_006329 [Rhodopirellula islandica]